MIDPGTRLERAIEQLGADHQPPPGWQARVLAAIEARSRWWARRWWLAVPAVAALAAVVIALLVARGPRSGPLTLTAALVPGPRVMRGDSGRIRAIAGGGDRHRAIWLYRDRRELVAVCPGHVGCSTLGGGGGPLQLELTVERIGSYQVVAVSSASALPAPTGAYEVDCAAAAAAGAWQQAQLEVR
jgi:hypothetical protein